MMLTPPPYQAPPVELQLAATGITSLDALLCLVAGVLLMLGAGLVLLAGPAPAR